MRIFSLILVIIFTFSRVPISYADQRGHAVILSDQELDEISAQGLGGLNISINTISSGASTVVSQGNIGALLVLNGGLLNSSIVNSNFAEVFNVGNSSIVGQGNIAVGFARNGDVDGVSIENSNYADITNLSNGSTDAGANITQTSLFSGGLNFFSGLVSASNSSVASQYNIAALVALEGSVLNSSIINSNIAEVFNLGNAALVAQNNIAIAIARNGIIDNVTISNTNEATVINNVNGVDGGAQVGSFVLNKGNLNITINAESVTNSIGIIQNNITILSVIGSSLNSLSGVNIENINISNIINNL